MYPTVVILLVETQRSMMDVCEISPSDAPSKVTAPAGPEDLFYDRANGPSRTSKESLCSRALQSQCRQEHSLDEVVLEVKESQVGLVAD